MKIYLFNSDFSLNCQIGTPDLHQYEDNATLVFCHIDGIDEANYTDYVATFAATLPGAAAPTADIITEFGELEVSGIAYKGFKYFVSRKFTQIAGSLNANFVLAKDGVTKVTQSVFLNVMASSGGAVWDESITQAQWYQLLAYSVGLRNPNLGVIDTTIPNILDDYRTDAQLGAYLFTDAYACGNLLFVTKDDQGYFNQTRYYCGGNGAMYCATRIYDDGEWSEWDEADNASAISYAPENGGKLKQLSDEYTVQEAITALDKLMANPVVFALNVHTNLNGVSIDSYFKFSEITGGYTILNLDDSNLSDDDYSTFVSKYAKIGKVIPSANLVGNQITMVCADGSVYSLIKEGGTTARLMLVGRYATKGELDSLHNSFETKSLLVKNGSITNLRSSSSQFLANVGGNYIGINPSTIELFDKGNVYYLPYPSGYSQSADDTKLMTKGLVDAAIATAVSSVYKYKGSVSTYSDLPSSDLTIGDVYNIATADPDHGIKAGDNVAWNGSAWDVLAGDVDLSNYYTISQVDSAIATATYDMATKTWVNTKLDGYYTKHQVENNFAPLKGEAPYLTVGAANNFTPYGPETTSKQTAPFIIEGTATNNNTGKVDTGALAYIKAKLGNSVVVNQKVEIVTRTNTVTDQDSYVQNNLSHVVSAGHKVLVMGKCTPSANLKMAINFFSDGHGNYKGESTNADNFAFVETLDYDTTVIFNIVPQAGFVGSEDVTSESYVIDLTQWFGSNDLIPSDLLSHPEHFSRYYNGSLEYNEGELVSAQGVALISRGRNVWDEKWGNYIWDEGANGVRVDNPQSVGCKDYIVALPNATYYLYSGTAGNFYVLFYDADKNYLSYDFIGENTTFTTPANCRYITFYSYSSYGTTYNNDITISIYYPNEGGYDQYYAYVGNVGAVVTGNETLRSCGSVHDEKSPSGTITRKVGTYTFQGGEWTATTANRFYMTSLNALIKPSTINILVPNFKAVAKSSVELSDYQIGVDVDGTIYIHATSSTTLEQLESLLEGKTMNYELATPTAETGTSFPANLPIEDFGYLMWAYATGAKQIPQGVEIDYPADYRGFVDSLIREVSGDTTKIVNALMSQSDFDEVMNGYGYYKLTELAGYDDTKTQTLKNVSGTLTWVDDE